MADIIPLNRSRLHEKIVRQIQKRIFTGVIKPGEKLPPERELAVSFQVNRATIREALRKLESLELLEIRHGDGVYTKDYLESGNLELVRALVYLEENDEPLLAILEVRRILIPEMAFLAAERCKETEIKDLRLIINSEEFSILEKDLRVHLLIARASRNLFYSVLLNFFNQIYRDLGHLYFNNPKNAERSETFHWEILKAMENRDAESAKKIMAEVLLYAETSIREYLIRNPRGLNEAIY